MAKPTKAIGKAIKKPRRGLWRGLRFLRGAPEEKPDRGAARDVWQWTNRKYRIRSVLLLLINTVLFAVLGCFTYWLRTGEYNPFANDQYWRLWWAAADPTREQQVTLIDFLLYPIPVDQVPMMMVIVGLVLASLTAIPILVSMLYRFPFALIFTCIVGFVAVLPWLAVCVTLCCYLARWRPLRFSFRYATALISMLPLVLYYALATRNVSAFVHLTPLEAMAKLYMPWILAIIAGCLVMAIVLIIARLVNDRPGAIAPLLTVMFAIPVVLFEVKVGEDELYYRLLESRFGPGSRTLFVNHVDASPTIRRIAEARLCKIEDPRATLQSVIEQVRFALQFQLDSLSGERDQVVTATHEAFALQQHEARQACEEFANRFPGSRYVPNALYIEGRACDMRVDREFFRRALILHHYEDFPSEASRSAWRELKDRFPNSPVASVAYYRLTILEVRAGNVDRAVQLLKELISRFGNQKDNGVSAMEPGGWREYFAKRPASGTLDVDPRAVAQRGRQLLDLLENNRDPHQNDQALQRLLKCDPHHAMYRQNLERLLADIESGDLMTNLGDNAELLLATIEPSRSLKIGRLKELVKKLAGDPKSDALPRAWYELGSAYAADTRPKEARAAFELVYKQFPQSPWVTEASRRLAAMGVVGGTTGL